MGIRRVPSFLAAVVVVTATFAAIAPRPRAQESVDYRPPVDAPVVDPFRPPATTYGPGNRGLTYDLAPATAVRASAPGEVVFAGPVAGTSTSPSSTPTVCAPATRSSIDRVHAGPAGRGRRHRGGRRPRVPLRGPRRRRLPRSGRRCSGGSRSGSTSCRPRSRCRRPTPACCESASRWPRWSTSATPSSGSSAGPPRSPAGPSTCSGPGSRPTSSSVGSELVRDVAVAVTEHWSDECTPGGVTVTPGGAGRVALLVGGYGSASTRAGIDGLDTADLGYRPGDVLRYSYAGGRHPRPRRTAGPGAGRHPRPPLRPRRHLRRPRGAGRAVWPTSSRRWPAPDPACRSTCRPQPGRHRRPARPARPGDRPGGPRRPRHRRHHRHAPPGRRSGHHRRPTRRVRAPVRRLPQPGHRVGGRPAAASVAQMAETSDLIAQVAAPRACRDGVDFRTIGARGDLVVAGDHTSVAGHPSAMLDLFGPAAHGDLPASSGTTREIGLALAGLAPGCRGVLDRVLDATVAQGRSPSRRTPPAPPVVDRVDGFPGPGPGLYTGPSARTPVRAGHEHRPIHPSGHPTVAAVPPGRLRRPGCSATEGQHEEIPWPSSP